MKQEYEALFTPWHIGNVEIKNRIVQCSMGGTSIFGWMEPNHFDKEAANFLLERAKNNVGLILPGIAPIRDTFGGKWLYQNTGKFKQLKAFMEEYHKTGDCQRRLCPVHTGCIPFQRRCQSFIFQGR